MTPIEDFSRKGRKGRGLPVCGVVGEGVSWDGQNGQGFLSAKELSFPFPASFRYFSLGSTPFDFQTICFNTTNTTKEH